jgi:hypothetical protein
MRAILAYSLILAMVPTLPALAQSRSSKKEPAFQEYNSGPYDFKAFFPGKPKEVSKKQGSKAGELMVATVTLEERDITYCVTATRFPDKVKAADGKRVLAAVIDALSAEGGKLITNETYEVPNPKDKDAKIAGREVVVEFGKNQVRSRVLIHGATLYQISVTGTKDKITGPTAGKFLASFELTG